jgi:hypothetical protein
MPTFRVRLSDGRVVTLEAPQEPTEAEVLSALGDDPQSPMEPPQEDAGADVGMTATAASLSAAPGIVSLANKTARVVGPLAAKVTKSRYTPAAVLGTAAAQAGGGNVKGAAGTVATAAAASQVPRAIGILQRLTEPITGKLPSGASYALKPGVTGAVTRGAQALSRASGPLTALSMTNDTRNDLLKYVNDPSVSPEVREAIMRAIQGGGAM